MQFYVFSFMGKLYKEKLETDMVLTEHMKDAAELAKMKDIRDNAYRYDTQKKHKTNAKYLKRKITIAEMKIKSNLNGFLSSLFSAFEPEISAYSNQLREIEKEIQAEHEKEQEQLNTTPTPHTKWSWGKI